MTGSTNIVALPSTLEGCARRIKTLMEDWSKNTIALGRELKIARDNFPVVKSGKRPGWYNWIKSKLGISPSYAISLIAVADKFGDHGRRLPPGLSSEIMRLLTVKSVPAPAETEILDRLDRGERVSKRHAAKIIKEHKLPKPAEANKIAKETGKAQEASDGNIYFGTSKADAQAGEDRRTVVYGVKDAIQTLAEIELTPINFIKYMLPHQRWARGEEKQINKAREWLNELAKEWDKWEDD